MWNHNIHSSLLVVVKETTSKLLTFLWKGLFSKVLTAPSDQQEWRLPTGQLAKKHIVPVIMQAQKWTPEENVVLENAFLEENLNEQWLESQSTTERLERWSRTHRMETFWALSAACFWSARVGKPGSPKEEKWPWLEDPGRNDSRAHGLCELQNQHAVFPRGNSFTGRIVHFGSH